MPLPTVIGRPLAHALNIYKGQYFMTVDGDDYLNEHALSNIVSIIKKQEPDLIMGTYLCDIEEGQSNFLDAEFDEKKINDVPYFDALSYITNTPNFHTFQWRFIINRGVLDRNKTNYSVKKDEIYSRYNDGITVAAYLIFAKSIVYMPKPFYIYRRRGSSLSSDKGSNMHSIEFLKSFFAIADKFELILKEKTPERRQIIYSILRARFELFRILFAAASEENLIELSNLIEKKYKLMKYLKPISDEYIEFYKCICFNKQNFIVGLRQYLSQQKAILEQGIERCLGRTGYVFPTGLCGFQTYEFLKNQQIEILSFLDNDPLKNGVIFSDVPCALVDSLACDKDIKERFVYIATGHKNNLPKMKAQVLGYGISEENIIVR